MHETNASYNGLPITLQILACSFGEAVAIKVEYLSSLERGRTGKLRFVVSGL